MERRKVSAGTLASAALVVALLPNGIAVGADLDRMLTLRVEASFPAGSPATVQVTQLSGDGEIVGIDSLALGAGDLGVPFRPGAELVQVSSPVHEPCERPLPRQLPLECRLGQKVIVIPPGPVEERWRIWRRPREGGAFREIAPLPEGWGRGFAVSKSTADFVAAPAGGCAALTLGASVGSTPGLSLQARVPTRPYALRARFVEPTGGGISDVPVVEHVRPEDREPTATESAWAAWYGSRAAAPQKDGTLLLEPLPCETASLQLSFPGRQPVAINGSRAVAGLLDLGDIALPRLATLEVMVELNLEGVEGKPVGLKGTLMRPQKGLQAPKRGNRFDRTATGPGNNVSLSLFPGEWLIAVTVDGKAVAERTVRLSEGQAASETIRVGPVRVSGRVEARKKAVEGVTLVASYFSDGRNPLAQTVSDDRGEFEMVIPGTGGPFLVGMRAPGGSSSVRQVDPSKDDLEGLVLSLPNGSTIVFVKDATTGLPVPDVPVVLRLVSTMGDGKAYANPEGRTGPDGRVAFSQLEDGELTVLWAGDQNWLPDRTTLGQVCRMSGSEQEESEVEVRVRPARKARVRLSGTSAGAGGVLMGPFESAGGSESLRRWSASADGVVEVHVLRGVRTLFAAYAAGSRVQFFFVEPQEDEKTVVLTPARPAPLLSFTFAGEGRRTVGIEFGFSGQTFPAGWMSAAFAASGCSTTIPERPGSFQLDQCLENGVYTLSAIEPASGRRTPLVPGVVALQDGNLIALTVPDSK